VTRAAGYAATFTFTATVTAPPGSSIQNCATATNQNDVYPPNNDACATVAIRRCVGDCDASTEVTVNELITMVNIALGNEDVATCISGDPSGDGRVTVEEIIKAVNNALDGCPLETGGELPVSAGA